MKNKKSGSDADPTAKNIHFKQEGIWWEEAQIAITKQAITKRPLSHAENVTTAKSAPRDKYAGK